MGTETATIAAMRDEAMDTSATHKHFEQAYRRARLYRSQRERALAVARAEKAAADELARQLRLARAEIMSYRLAGAA